MCVGLCFQIIVQLEGIVLKVIGIILQQNIMGMYVSCFWACLVFYLDSDCSRLDMTFVVDWALNNNYLSHSQTALFSAWLAGCVVLSTLCAMIYRVIDSEEKMIIFQMYFMGGNCFI